MTISPGVMAPLALVEFDEAGAMSRDTVAIQLDMCLIHTTDAISTTWRIPQGTPFCIHATTLIPTGGRKNRRKEADLTDEIRALLQSVIRSTNANFNQLVVTNRSVNHVSTEKYVVHPWGIGSQSCIKFRAEHTDSSIYFVLTPHGITQRCYSNEALVCGTNCKHREAKYLPLDEGVVRELFPGFSAAAPMPNISNSTQSPAYQIATRISDYHANIIRGGAGRKRNVYGDVKKAPAAAPPSRSGKRAGTSRDDEH